MSSITAPQAWDAGDRSIHNTANTVSDSTDQLLMAAVTNIREAKTSGDTQMKSNSLTAGDAQMSFRPGDSTDAKYLEVAGLFSNDSINSKVQAIGTHAQRYLASQDPSVFEVRSGRFKGMKVDENLRCAIFQSNIAVKAGLISPSEVTVRAVEFGQLVKSKGYREERFDPKKEYPDGAYIVGKGGGPSAERNHVALVWNDKMIHTSGGEIRHDPFSVRFRPGAYDSIRVYIPPRTKRG